jgi:hypothetical protein
MGEKIYPIFDEEEGIDMACEPVCAVEVETTKAADGVTIVHDWIDDLEWEWNRLHNRFPWLR